MEKKSDSKTIVFVGPSLSRFTDLSSRYPEYFFHGPIRCGDILQAEMEGFRTAIIIDGYFDSCAAVWHKEILEFIQNGGIVVGCSSMGALRALELEQYGMLGFGNIFNDYKEGRVTDDDEVTLVHLDEKHQYKCVSDALINIRYTVKAAIGSGAISEVDAETVIKQSKEVFYKERLLKQVLDRLIPKNPNLNSFKQYLDEHGLIDQKEKDALDLLSGLDVWLSKQIPETKLLLEGLSNTKSLRALRFWIQTEAPSLEASVLSSKKRNLKILRLLGLHYKSLQWLSVAAACFFDHSKIYFEGGQFPSWLHESFFDETPWLTNAVRHALGVCPEYYDHSRIPATVRHLSIGLGIPFESLGFRFNDPDKSPLLNWELLARILWLAGLFLDARTFVDPVASRVWPSDHHAADQLSKLASYFNRLSLDSEQQTQAMGFSNQKELARRIVRNNWLLSNREIGSGKGFRESAIYWFEVAAQISGAFQSLERLKDEKEQKLLVRNIVERLSALDPRKKVALLLNHGLSPELVDEEKIASFINNHL